MTPAFRRLTLLSLIITTHLYAAPATTTALAAQPDYQQGQQWLQQRLQQRQQQRQQHKERGRAQNVILFLGDGMSVTTLTAARILEGQNQGLSGEEHRLYFETFPYSALVKTYNTNQQTPDSAGTMSAITTGVKTRAGVIAIGPEQDRGICQGAAAYHQPTLLQWAQQQGYATGVVTTARITHATPAASYAHSPERNWEADSDLSREARRYGCRDIAWQLIHQAYPAGLDIALGGGKRNFSRDGERHSGNLIADWQQQFPGGQYLENRQQLMQLRADTPGPVLGLFADSHLDYHLDHSGQQPDLAEMTRTALAFLQQQKQHHPQRGYLLIVEGARIDHGHHAGNAKRALDETIELARAVQLADQLSDNNTLLLVTADHSHTLSMAGYPQRGNDILGFAANQGLLLANDQSPYTTLGYANGPGGSADAQHSERLPGRIFWHKPEHRQTKPHSDNFQQAALADIYAETHGADDVALHARGPGARLFQGLLEQHEIFHRIRRALLQEN